MYGDGLWGGGLQTITLDGHHHAKDEKPYAGTRAACRGKFRYFGQCFHRAPVTSCHCLALAEAKYSTIPSHKRMALT